jgi:hypothetical protein
MTLDRDLYIETHLRTVPIIGRTTLLYLPSIIMVLAKIIMAISILDACLRRLFPTIARVLGNFDRHQTKVGDWGCSRDPLWGRGEVHREPTLRPKRWVYGAAIRENSSFNY